MKHRGWWKNPILGFSLPWIVMGFLVWSLQNAIGPAADISKTVQASWFESTHQYKIAVDLLEAQANPEPGLMFWKHDLTRSAGMGAFLSGDFLEASEMFTRIIDRQVKHNQSHDYFVLLYRGIAFFKRGQVIKARQDWGCAIEAFPQRHDAWLALGHSYLTEGDLLRAQSYYSIVLKLSNQLGPVYVDIGDAWRSIGNNELARQMYQAGLHPDPADVFCRLRLGEMALIMDNDPARTLQLTDQIQRMMPDLNVVARLETAALNWSNDKTLRHMPAARFEPGSARNWKLSPTKILFEFFRPQWTGWE